MNKRVEPMMNTLKDAESMDNAFIIAAAFNLYIETCRRLEGRVLLSPEDIQSVGKICDILLYPKPSTNGYAQNGRSRKLTQEEEAQVLQGLEKLNESPDTPQS